LLFTIYYSQFTISVFEKITDSLLTIIYPQACQICGESVERSENGVVCESCWRKTALFDGTETLCHKCGRFLSEKPSNFQTFCHLCDEHFYDTARAAGLYEDALRASILHLKREPFAAKTLQKILIETFNRSEFQDTDLIIPVPLSKKRFLERGFNQAAVLTDILAQKLNITPDLQSLIRTVHTPMHRAGMDTKARELTVKNAFEVKRPKLIEGKTILLVDDVFTSGATASFCAKSLKKSGAKKIYVLTIARAGKRVY
jgi:competence protein ComFC